MNGDVYKAENKVGRLVRHTDMVEFSYDPSYAGEPVASTLPVSASPYVAPAGQLPAFFVGLLPEGRRLIALRQQLKLAPDDELAQLLAVGGDTVGDVRVVPEGEDPSTPPSIAQDLSWSDVDLEQLFNTSIDTDYDAIAIAGVQPKISGKMISFPSAGSGGPVIIKLNPPEFRYLTSNEAAMLNVANSVGFEVPNYRLISDRHGTEGLVLSRFDRTESDPTVRHPVEDGCQALGRFPADKYNLDTVEVIVGLARLCDAPAVATLQLAHRFLFAYLSGDGDLHARNMSIWRSPSGLWKPTPWYDLVCTAIYADMTMAAPLNGEDDIREIGRRRFLAAADSMGLPTKASEHLLDFNVPKIAAAVAASLDSPPFTLFPNVQKVKRVLARRAALLI